MKTFSANKGKAIFQVLLLNNDSSNDVAVKESEEVNFSQVKEHLRNGGSVFITSKDSQKITYHKVKAQQNYNRSRRVVGNLFRQNMKHM